MTRNCLARYFIPISSNISVFISFAFAGIAAAFLFIVGIFLISKKLMFSMIALIASIVLTFILTIFTAITYNSTSNVNEALKNSIFISKKKFLLTINILLIIVLGAMAFCLYSFRNDYFEFIDLVFNDYYNSNSKILSSTASSSEKFVKYVENYFNCERFNSTSPSGNCAEFIKDFLDSKTKFLSIVLGSVSVFCLIILIIGIFLDYKFTSESATKVNDDKSEDTNYDLHQELNPNIAEDF